MIDLVESLGTSLDAWIQKKIHYYKRVYNWCYEIEKYRFYQCRFKNSFIRM